MIRLPFGLLMPDSSSILLVDDDRHLAESMAEWLRELSHQVTVAESIKEAKESLARQSFELAIFTWVTVTDSN